MKKTIKEKKIKKLKLILNDFVDKGIMENIPGIEIPQLTNKFKLLFGKSYLNLCEIERKRKIPFPDEQTKLAGAIEVAMLIVYGKLKEKELFEKCKIIESYYGGFDRIIKLSKESKQ